MNETKEQTIQTSVVLYQTDLDYIKELATKTDRKISSIFRLMIKYMRENQIQL